MEQTRPRPEAGNPLERQLQSVIPADQWGMTPCWGQVPRKGEHMPWARPEGPGGRCTPGHQTRNRVSFRLHHEARQGLSLMVPRLAVQEIAAEIFWPGGFHRRSW